MDVEELRTLIRILEESSLSELEVEQDGRRVRLSKGAVMAPQFYAPAAPPPGPGGAPAHGGPIPAPEETDADTGLIMVESPMVGTFYASHSPGEAPFVLPGDRVQKDQTVCIVEAMKIMNEVVARHAGVIEKILVENGQPVEFGQPLFALRPH